MRRLLAYVTVPAVALLLTACGQGAEVGDSSGPESGAAELTVVEPYATPRLGSAGDILHATPEEQGYFSEENLTVDVAYADGSTAALQALAGGQGDIAAASLSSALQAKEKGLPLKVLSASVINYPWKMATLPGSTIAAPEDLDGKTVGIISLASESNTFTMNFIKQAGLEESDVQTLAVGTGAAATEALRSGEVDVLALYDSVYQQLEGQGAEFAYIDNPPMFEDVVSIALVTGEDSLEKNRDAIERYLRAYNKGVLYAVVNPEAAVLDSFEVYEDFLAGTTAEEALPKGAASLTAYLETATPSMDYTTWPDGWRNISPEQWEATTKYTLDAGMVQAPIAQDDLYDGSLNEAASDFDHDAIASEAEAASREPQ